MAAKNAEKPNGYKASRLSVAPMLDWTDRHCRYLHRCMSRHVLLYTEMVTTPALVRGGARHLLRFDPAEHPVAVQLGGSDPAELAQAARMAADEGYDEINLNLGCPSDRVQSGRFGAVLMKEPGLVADCISAMIAAQPVEVTVKCRIGVDDQQPADTLPAFIETMRDAGVRRMVIHARKAWLQGLSPRQNRDIPPLDYPLVHAMKRQFPDMHLTLNGGVASLAEAKRHLDAGMDGVMIGRAAYHNPADILLPADAEIYGVAGGCSALQVVDRMRPHIAAHLAAGGRLHSVTRHMLGLFAGRPGARHWRRVLSEQSHRDGAGLDVLDAALAHVAGGEARHVG
ncbi:MAG: tRNA dihydrouridine(20/20a) synthase DusA [Rhodobacteraceae bacterium]|nr:tRNA dihydrouridine(20/20a) synthase DusA [Paracoccaceae bacterium]